MFLPYEDLSPLAGDGTTQEGKEIRGSVYQAGQRKREKNKKNKPCTPWVTKQIWHKIETTTSEIYDQRGSL